MQANFFSLEAGYVIDEINGCNRISLDNDLSFKYDDFIWGNAEFIFSSGEIKADHDISSKNSIHSFISSVNRGVNIDKATDSKMAVLYNIVSRGKPTRASLYLTEHFLGKSFSEQHNTEIVFENVFEKKQADVKAICDQLNCIAKVQKSLTLLFHLRPDIFVGREKLAVYCNKKHQSDLILALGDIKKFYDCLSVLEGSKDIFPSIAVSANKRKRYDLGLFFDEEKYEDIQCDVWVHLVFSKELIERYKLATDADEVPPIEPFDRFLCATRISYQNLQKRVKKDVFGVFRYRNKEQQEALLYLLQSLFRKKSFRAGQEPIINRVMQRKDVVGLLPTGGGKSLTYQLMGLLQPAVNIIVAPINSLMRDQHEKLTEHYIDSIYINSYNTVEQKSANQKQLQSGGSLYTFVSPERFQMDEFQFVLRITLKNRVFFGHAVIDEAHCVSEWGHDFRLVYLNLAENIRRYCRTIEQEEIEKQHKQTFLNTPIFALTATASYDVLADIQRDLAIDNEAVQTLPPEQIDRSELMFKIFPIEGSKQTNSSFFVRELELFSLKSPVLQEFINALDTQYNNAFDNRVQFLVEEISKRQKTKTYDSGELDALQHNLEKAKSFQKQFAEEDRKSFFHERDTTGEYRDSGIIFCPTKSNKLANGVLYIKEKSLSTMPTLEITTFFSSVDENSNPNKKVDLEAIQAFENQTKFIANQANLMISTKAFGMGIDKPNIRFTIHYAFPNSVESFYQEAGRAGRDRTPAVCAILYSPVDEESNMDFLENSFKGVEKEKAVIQELLEEVSYEDRFFVNYIGRLASQKLEREIRLSLTSNHIYIYGRYHEEKEKNEVFGSLHIATLTKHKLEQNVASDEAEMVRGVIAKTIKDHCPDTHYKDWLTRVQHPGIESLIHTFPDRRLALPVSFENGEFKAIDKIISSYLEGKKLKSDQFNSLRLIRAAYNFNNSFDDFFDNLNYSFFGNTDSPYYSQGNWDSILSLEEKEEMGRIFLRLRNSEDTHRAIYRLKIIGVIDDYTVNYHLRAFVLKFSAKEPDVYYQNYDQYLAKYLGDERRREHIEKLQEDPKPLRATLSSLVGFVSDTIVKKRRASIGYMKELCELGVKEGDGEFRQNIIYYFTSKYARNDYLPRDTEEGKDNLAIVRKYIDFMFDPPDGLGTDLDNIKHLRGACARVLLASAEENHAVNLLNAFVHLVLESQGIKKATALRGNPRIVEALQSIDVAYRYFFNKINYTVCVESMLFYVEKAVSLNNVLKTVLKPRIEYIILDYHQTRLTQLITKLTA